MAAPPLISILLESALWNLGKVVEVGVLPTIDGGANKRGLVPDSLTESYSSFITHHNKKKSEFINFHELPWWLRQ